MTLLLSSTRSGSCTDGDGAVCYAHGDEREPHSAITALIANWTALTAPLLAVFCLLMCYFSRAYSTYEAFPLRLNETGVNSLL